LGFYFESGASTGESLAGFLVVRTGANLGIQPILAQLFDEERTAGRDDVVIISTLLAQSFSLRPANCRKRQIALNRRSVTIVGVYRSP